jgi:hypothetical protein
MGRSFWIKRFVVVTASIFFVLMVAELLNGHGIETSLLFSAMWSLIASSVFTGARIYHSRRGRHCAICRDSPEPKKSVA